MQTAPKEHSIAKDQKLKVNGEPHKVPPRPNKASTNLQNKPEPSKIKAAALSKKRSPKNLNKKSKNMISPTERSGAKPKLHQFNKTGMKGLETKPKMHVKETKKLVKTIKIIWKSVIALFIVIRYIALAVTMYGTFAEAVWICHT
uniref:Uncharacterized protein n=1 Tax=Ciona intestinalis TaxID=7719 RepID=H2XXW2_CIOIN